MPFSLYFIGKSPILLFKIEVKFSTKADVYIDKVAGYLQLLEHPTYTLMTFCKRGNPGQS